MRHMKIGLLIIQRKILTYENERNLLVEKTSKFF
ncbi:hypothetical protein JOC85_002676 [Bacillus mesophilus]|nr:hypothetical protein [Bacillus mesophilus]